MDAISEAIFRSDFQRRLREARGNASHMLVRFAGDKAETTINNGRIEGDPAPLAHCITDVAKVAELPIKSARAFACETHSAVTVNLALPGADSTLSIYHDTAGGGASFEILHPQAIQVDLPSESDRLALSFEPYGLVQHHLGSVADEIVAILKRIGLRPSPAALDDIGHETYGLPLEGDGTLRKPN